MVEDDTVEEEGCYRKKAVGGDIPKEVLFVLHCLQSDIISDRVKAAVVVPE